MQLPHTTSGNAHHVIGKVGPKFSQEGARISKWPVTFSCKAHASHVVFATVAGETLFMPSSVWIQFKVGRSLSSPPHASSTGDDDLDQPWINLESLVGSPEEARKLN